MSGTGKVVYSTDGHVGKPCPRCGRSPCRCPRPPSLPPSQQTARLERQKKGRGGKTVTVVAGLELSPQDLAGLARRLKGRCACGGTVKDGQIEVQGDQREAIAAVLKELGYKVKFVGG